MSHLLPAVRPRRDACLMCLCPDLALRVPSTPLPRVLLFLWVVMLLCSSFVLLVACVRVVCVLSCLSWVWGWVSAGTEGGRCDGHALVS